MLSELVLKKFADLTDVLQDGTMNGFEPYAANQVFFDWQVHIDKEGKWERHFGYAPCCLDTLIYPRPALVVRTMLH